MNLAAFIGLLRSSSGYNDPTVVTDTDMTLYVRMGEERLNQDLRIDSMVNIVDNIVVSANKVPVPADWLETDFLAVDDEPLEWKDRTTFYKEGKLKSQFSTGGRNILLGDWADNTPTELHYFTNVPVLAGTATWLSTKFPRLLLSATMVPLSMRTEETERAAMYEADVSATINKMNTAYEMSKAPRGSRLRRVPKGFKNG